MQLVRPIFASHPFRFGRGQARALEERSTPSGSVRDDFKLFAATFLAGFLFVSILIG
jgi:hypothetical protein